MKKKKIGVFGGSFDPIHNGHIHLALSLKELVGLDEVLFVPTTLSPFKSSKPPVASAADRLEMVRQAIAPIGGFSVLDWEIRGPGPTYTIDTIRRLQEEGRGELHLLMGDDLLPRLNEWKESAALQVLAPPLVGSRTGPLQIPLLDISSTRVRERLSKKYYCGHLVPQAVLDYIQAHGLYSSAV
ncbi:MAG: nicotinate-nicotinamide nucleotide adenylyltransferase [Verrucomicrobia bacterium]|nr:nicotinate-nicotinamide nucleotide adenylyltransferase [Verrucomicrobiota bacterium]